MMLDNMCDQEASSSLKQAGYGLKPVCMYIKKTFDTNA